MQSVPAEFAHKLRGMQFHLPTPLAMTRLKAVNEDEDVCQVVEAQSSLKHIDPIIAYNDYYGSLEDAFTTEVEDMHHVHSNSPSLSLSIYIYVVAKTIHRVDRETQTAMVHVLGCMGGGGGG